MSSASSNPSEAARRRNEPAACGHEDRGEDWQQRVTKEERRLAGREPLVHEWVDDVEDGGGHPCGRTPE